MRSKLDTEFERLEKEGIIVPIKYSDWASPCVPVLKQDKTVRICGDYKVTINKVIKKEIYPLPCADDLFTKLEGGVKFAKIDLSHAYQQLELDEESQKLLVLNTHKGLMRYTRLNYGVATAPAIFQRAMEGVLNGIPKTAVFLDDIIVTGSSPSAYERNLNEVLHRLEEAGMTLKESKCEIDMSEVKYLGYKVSAQGLEPLPEKIKPITDAPAPTNVSELSHIWV